MAKVLNVKTNQSEQAYQLLVNDAYMIPTPDSYGWFVFKGELQHLAVHGRLIEYISLEDSE